MSTRAVITFKTKDTEHKVYKHHDGYPHSAHGILAAIHASMDLAWPLPRFESDEFAAAFVAATKKVPGDVRLLNEKEDVGDAAYRYTVMALGRTGAIKVTWRGQTKGSTMFTKDSFILS